MNKKQRTKANRLKKATRSPVKSEETIQNYPPVEGEYSYYDSRLNGLNNIKLKHNHFLVIVEGKECSCHYSSNTNFGNRPFITCHGIIEKVGKEIKN